MLDLKVNVPKFYSILYLKVMVSGSSALFMPITSITLSTVDACMTDRSVYRKLSIFFRIHRDQKFCPVKYKIKKRPGPNEQ